MTNQETKQQKARRRLNNFASFTRRGNLTGWENRNARYQFEAAFRAVLDCEDAFGIDASAKLSDRLDAIRREAMDKHLLTAGDVLEIETKVCDGLN